MLAPALMRSTYPRRPRPPSAGCAARKTWVPTGSSTDHQIARPIIASVSGAHWDHVRRGPPRVAARSATRRLTAAVGAGAPIVVRCPRLWVELKPARSRVQSNRNVGTRAYYNGVTIGALQSTGIRYNLTILTHQCVKGRARGAARPPVLLRGPVGAERHRRSSSWRGARRAARRPGAVVAANRLQAKRFLERRGGRLGAARP